MNIRKPQGSDLEKLVELQKRFDHDFDLSQSIGTAVAEDGGKLIAIGALFPRLEAALLVDHEIQRHTRAEAIRLLHNVAVQVASVHGAHKLLAFSKSPAYSNYLVKRLGFERLNEVPLLLEL